MAERPNKRLLYGAMSVACVVLAAGGLYYAFGGGAQAPDTPPATARAPATQPAPPADPSILTSNQIDRAAHFNGEARRLAAAGKLAEVETALQNAEKAAPGLPETAAARREIAEMQTPKGQLGALVLRARVAIDRGDTSGASQAIAEIEKLDGNASELAVLRRDAEAARKKTARHDDRVASLVATMREAVARGDFAAANSALNEAERLDVQSPSVEQARAELRRAQREREAAVPKN